jgi:hypothetical protein
MNRMINLISFLLILSSSLVISKDIPSQFFITAGADANAIIYSSDFKNFEGVQNCCTRFTSAFGISFNLHAGLEYHSSFFGLPAVYDLSLSYSDISAKYNQEYPFANIITGNTYTKAVSEFILEPTINLVSIEPGLYLTPFDKFPFSFRIGFQAGILLGKTFSQQENLISPDNVFFENGSRTRGVYSGSISNASSMNIAVSVGARLRAYKAGSISIYPEIRYNHGLTDMVNGLNWKSSSVQAGVMIAFNIPQGSTPPPPAPPLPEFPEVPQPPTPSFVNVKLIVSADGESKKDGDELVVPYNEFVTEYRYTLLPFIFFKENSLDEFGDSETTYENIGEAGVHKFMLKSIAGLMNKTTDLKVNIIASSLNTEEESIVDARINKVAEELQYYGIGINRMTISKKTVSRDDFKEPLLADENIYVRLDLSDGTKLIHYSEIKPDKKEFKQVTLGVKPEIITTSDIKAFKGVIIGFDTLSFESNGITTALNPNIAILSDRLIITANAENQDGTKAGDKVQLKLNYKAFDTALTVNPLPKSSGSQFILCYFDYDRSDSKIINENVAGIVRSAIAHGKKVTFLAQTDNIGTENYNSDLAMKRGRKAMDLFNGNSGKINLIQPSYYIFSNLTPLGRMLNRTVVVRIED